MSKINITFETDNASFGETVGEVAEEIADILKDLAKKILEREYEFVYDEQAITIYDHNGNSVGEAQYHN